MTFAYQTFKWVNESKGKAAVHCVIVGFNQVDQTTEKYIYSGDGMINKVQTINPYLVEAPDVFIDNIKKTEVQCT